MLSILWYQGGALNSFSSITLLLSIPLLFIDFIFMSEQTSYMFVTGPEVVKTVTHEDVDTEYLGGANTHTTKSGVADFSFDNEITVLQQLRRLFDFLPQSNISREKVKKSNDNINRKIIK